MTKDIPKNLGEIEVGIAFFFKARLVGACMQELVSIESLQFAEDCLFADLVEMRVHNYRPRLVDGGDVLGGLFGEEDELALLEIIRKVSCRKPLGNPRGYYLSHLLVFGD